MPVAFPGFADARYLAPRSRWTDFLLDEREASECSYLINRIRCHLWNARPGDEDLLTEIQGIESLQKPLFDSELVMDFLKQAVVDWLQVSSNSFLQVK